MIKIEKVNKYFNRFKRNQIHVIDNTSLQFEKNGLVALLGPSGCGKTTLLNSIGGLDKVSNGKIYINGKKITRKSTYIVDKVTNLNIGYIFQDYLLLDNLTVFDNIALSLKMIGITNKEEVKKRVNYVLEKVGMYRYRNRIASMLSGGERQRVGIARAIVKNPAIIIADEPTGNLDSKNTIEIMNIIKSISKEKLVILVTHEKDIAYFYSSRIIELKDGKVISDKINEHNDELDYRMDNKIYLQDIEKVKNFSDENYKINCYTDKDEIINLNIVVKNGNIYIQSNTKDKIEIVDESTSIEFIDDHYKKITSAEYENYDFHQPEFNKKLKYKSILNPFTTITNGFRKVFEYSFIKKLLLLGFFASGMFILYSLSNIFGVTNIKEDKFVNTNKEYLILLNTNVKVEDYLSYEQMENINYILPGSSIVEFSIKYNDFYQTSRASDSLKGSLSSIEMIKEKDLIYGNMPENEYEIVVDQMTFDRMYKNNLAIQAGYDTYEKFINKSAFLSNKEFKIVGIVDKKSPSIYVNKNLFINIIANSNNNSYDYYAKGISDVGVIDYNLKTDNVSLKEGRWPTNDYEVVINIKNKESMPINKNIPTKVNNKELLVVGYYVDKYNSDYYLVNLNTVKYNTILNNSNITIYPKDKEVVLKALRDKNLNVEDSYSKDKEEYMKAREESVTIALIVAGTILAISFIEIFLIIRSSFLSRIKEVSIYRAIGVKRTDICKMFYGEIIAITTIGGIPGIIFMYYIISRLIKISFISDMYMLNTFIVLLALIIMYLFNIIVGLIPVFNTIRKKPAQILSRIDIE